VTQTLARSLLSCIAFAPLSGTYARVPQPFTVAEEIGLAHFGDPYTAETQATGFSPDGNYFAAHTERGRLDLNRPEAALRIYRTQDVLGFLGHPQGSPPPPPVWTFRRSTADSGPIITHWRWLADSSGIAYLERGTNGSNRLVLAELKQKTIEPLTPHGQTIKAFDIRDRNHYVYALADLRLQQQAMAERKTAAVLGTGRALTDLLFPADQNPQVAAWADRSELWAVVDGKRFQIKDQSTGRPVVLFAGATLLSILGLTENYGDQIIALVKAAGGFALFFVVTQGLRERADVWVVVAAIVATGVIHTLSPTRGRTAGAVRARSAMASAVSPCAESMRRSTMFSSPSGSTA